MSLLMRLECHAVTDEYNSRIAVAQRKSLMRGQSNKQILFCHDSRKGASACARDTYGPLFTTSNLEKAGLCPL